MKRLTKKTNNDRYGLITENNIVCVFDKDCPADKSYTKLGQLEDIEDELGIDLITFFKGINPETCLLEVRDKKVYFCGDAYYGYYDKNQLLNLIQELLFEYWALTKEELEK